MAKMTNTCHAANNAIIESLTQDVVTSGDKGGGLASEVCNRASPQLKKLAE